ncbi:MAG: hypothetical protein WC192_00760 [Candidatus Babeliales bacterium]|jgi:hypothetical protein
MNKFDINSIHKGQPKGCPLLFIPIILTIFIAILPACSKKSIENTASQVQSSDINNPCEEATQNIYPKISPSISQVQIKKTHYKTFVNQARNIDISTPVGFRLEKSDSNEIVENRTMNDEILFFLYHGNQDIKKVGSFYKRELEILGWDFKDLSTKQEGLFICNKSSKTCVVSIRPKDISGSIICITITNKFDQN